MTESSKIQKLGGSVSVTIPKRIKTKLNLKAGEILFVEEIDERIIYSKNRF